MSEPTFQELKLKVLRTRSAESLDLTHSLKLKICRIDKLWLLGTVHSAGVSSLTEELSNNCIHFWSQRSVRSCQVVSLVGLRLDVCGFESSNLFQITGTSKFC